MISVFIIDDHLMVQAGIRALLAGQPDMGVVGTAANAYDAMQCLPALLPHVVLLDINLPQVDGITLCRRIRTELPHTRVLGMSTFDDRSYIARMIESGAAGYVFKNIGADELTDAIRQVHAGRMYLSPSVAAILSQPAPSVPVLPVLTRREKEVLTCIAGGLTNQQMGEQLFISPLTVDGHRKSLLAKFNVPNTASLIALAARHNLIL